MQYAMSFKLSLYTLEDLIVDSHNNRFQFRLYEATLCFKLGSGLGWELYLWNWRHGVAAQTRLN